MTITERQKLLDYMDKKNHIADSNEVFHNIANLIEKFMWKPQNEYTLDLMQNSVNDYFECMEQEKIVVVFAPNRNINIVGAILKRYGPISIKIHWVRPDGTLIY